jgi:hypothetical protein
MELPDDIRAMPFGEVVSRITTLNDGIRDFWSAAHGWAPADAADLLASARLDRQGSLSSCLSFWTEEPELAEQRDGALTLGWANVGALVEGTMKWFLCVYREDYPEGETAFKRKGKLLEPDALSLDQLRQFFARHVWIDSERDGWDQWLVSIRDRRNSIHSYQDRDIGDLAALHLAIREYLAFLREVHSRIPGYPDEAPEPYESLDDFR